MNEYLDDLDSILLALYLSVVLVLFFTKPKLDALSISLIAILLVEVSSYAIKPIRDMFDGHNVAHVWYLSFMGINLLACTFINRCHKKFKVKFTIFSMIVVSSYILLFFIQASRYIDRILIKSDVLGGLYIFSIPIINYVNRSSGEIYIH